MKRNKIASIALSLAIAFGLWLYVVTNVSTESETTFHDIPVQFEGETALEERKLMITSGTNAAVDLRLSGARRNLNNLTSSNITIKVDLSRVYDPGTHQIGYDIIFPGDVPSNAFVTQSKYPDAVTITVERRDYKKVPVKVVYSGSTPEDYLDDRDNALLDYPSIEITGPESVVAQVDRAEIYVDLTDRTASISEHFQYTLCNADGEPVDVELITAETAQVRLDLTVQRIKALPVTYTLVEGGGAKEANVTITMDTPEIRVSGSDALLEGLTEVNLGTINLAQIPEDAEMVFPVDLPAGVINLTGVDEVNVTIKFKGLATREFNVENIHIKGVPSGMDCEVVTKRVVVTLRGPSGAINLMTADDIVVNADLTGKEIGTHKVNATVTVRDPAFEAVGALGTISVSAAISEHVEGTT